MSSFIVKNATINRIVNFCFWQSDSSLKYDIQKELKSVGINLWGYYDDKETDKALKNFGLELLRLNAMAFWVRYSESTFDAKKEIKEEVESFVYEDTPLQERTIYKVSKSIHCFLYQCSEGDIPETNELYKCLERIRDIIDSHIVNSLPEYEAAEWG